MRRSRRTLSSAGFFWAGCALEAALLLLALVIAALLERPVFSDLHWRWRDLLLGLIASLPLGGLFLWMLHATWAPLARMRRLLVTGLRPLFARWSVLQLGVISVLAGVGEEVLFRSVIQGALAAYLEPWSALLIASALFGLAHGITVGYALAASAIGVYLGLCWQLGGNLLIPIVTHTVYDFLALVYFLRLWRDAPVAPAARP